MPELPEVETARSGLEPHLKGCQLVRVTVHNSRLRWPVTEQLDERLAGQQVLGIRRRAKYLLFDLSEGVLLIHLGMSGSLRLVDAAQPKRPHDHIEWHFDSGQVMRYHDPRRFGAVLWCPERSYLSHPLLQQLGPEPLSAEFDGRYLYQRAKDSRRAIKSFIMDGHIVVGVGNIYANEALFLAGIRPTRLAGQISRARYDRLADVIKAVLTQAIAVGGTTLRDFVDGSGNPGYFKQSLRVYGRGGEVCVNCSTPLQEIRLGQRSTVFCRQCQR